jgi:hypothetical protein
MKQKGILKTLKYVAMFSICPIESSFDVWVMFGSLPQIDNCFSFFLYFFDKGMN